MPSLKDLAAMTSQLDKLAGELHSELTEGAIDFSKMVGLADDIGNHSDRLASAFATMAMALEKSLNGSGGDGEGERDANA